ncbi:DUF6301 family protein [Actinomyces bowdenii]|uniref:Uncharacterized protein n=1 Tax=Actinomyces bowdenii TaxID=131109 RepID=A0A3P1V9E2_9ACTO|nr:DUF6301 family protein [Actinomyces bowdenii]RRD30120.1 hypothetical protein EII10_03335 [Actinomyces bowdenii]
MSDFRTLPVDEAIAWIRAWTDHAWPMTLQQAFTIRDHLGWRPSHQDPTLFTTKLSIDDKEDGFIFDSNEFGIKGVRFHFSSVYSLGYNHEVAQASHAAYSQYIAALGQLWRPGKVVSSDRISRIRWTFPNRMSTSISGLSGLISVTIDSSWRTQLKEDYDQVMEDYE